mmetsp:Transcript_40912/g.62328  ORF Transcript_40912/g.62328 Transcript_40912/m.62328 type:complete len:105 (-) Transcript_40912:74-388(-)|eukprot:CAMPEP_0170503926 /NCGR_PEP_ID=MMETSP0208-20121228/46363_1 /TAXON_ID=197538 /ORGANISM="Strombidium inclinatum, Strain S3" /LENGTH=104 /DNA_ID=CAMNT_0010783865 /DNA_START=1050 /DNA_END=1364 /DNA_ORIENTATION=+
MLNQFGEQKKASPSLLKDRRKTARFIVPPIKEQEKETTTKKKETSSSRRNTRKIVLQNPSKNLIGMSGNRRATIFNFVAKVQTPKKQEKTETKKSYNKKLEMAA